MLQSSSVLFDDRLTVLTTVTRNNKGRPVEEDRSNIKERLDSRHRSEIGVRLAGQIHSMIVSEGNENSTTPIRGKGKHARWSVGGN